MRRTWSTFANYAYTIAAQKDVLYVVKSILTNTNSVSNTLASSAIWTVTSSSNATTTSASDLWTSTAALTRASAGTAHSWVVMYNATLGLYLTLDYVGTLAYACDAILSTDQPSGGTTLNRPTTTNGVSFTWNFDRPTLTAETRYFSMTADTYGSFIVMHHRGNGEQVMAAMLSAVLTTNVYTGTGDRASGGYGDTGWLRPQPGRTGPTSAVWAFLQCGANQTGNAHLMTPTGTNTPANLFSATGGKVRLLNASYNTQASPNFAAAVTPPTSVTTAATAASYFGTVNSSTNGAGPVHNWPIMVAAYASSYFDMALLPDFYVNPYSTQVTSPTAATGGIAYASSDTSASTPISYVYCNGLIMPWGAPSTAIQGGQWWDNIPERTTGRPIATNFGGSKDNRISARNGRGVGGW